MFATNHIINRAIENNESAEQLQAELEERLDEEIEFSVNWKESGSGACVKVKASSPTKEEPVTIQRPVL